MTEPWDRPPFPARGNRSERVLFESIGRALMAWEEAETTLAQLYAVFATGWARDEPANKEYGVPPNYGQRMQALEKKASVFFARYPSQDDEGAFSAIVQEANGYSGRRNDIAHGVTRHIHWIINPRSSESLLSLADRLGSCVVPPHFRGNKFTKKNTPEYVLTSREINRFALAFWDIARHVMNLGVLLERRLRQPSPHKPTRRDA
jgi:hypothetical protein